MKHVILFIVLTFSINSILAQDFKQLSTHEFTSKDSYKTEQENVLKCANYLFNNPAGQAELNRLTAIQFIMKWMEGTPDYTFELGDKAMDLTKGNSDLLSLYLAAMSKAVIENKENKLTNDQIYSKAEDLLVNYCSNSKNNIKPSKKIKKLIKNKKN